jgi:hypothetical protein
MINNSKKVMKKERERNVSLYIKKKKNQFICFQGEQK